MTATDPAPTTPEGRPATSIGRRLATSLMGLPAVLLFFGLWEIASQAEWINPVVFPAPSAIASVTWKITQNGELGKHLAASATRAGSGLALAVVFGILVGLAIGRSRVVHQLLWPFLDFLRQIPPLAIFPVFLLFFGLGLGSKVAIVFWASVWPILLNTIVGVREVDPILVKASRSLDLSQRTTFTHVILPSAVPTIFAGLRLGATYSVLVLVGAEMVGAQSGIGFLIIQSQFAFKYRQMYGAILVLGVVGYILGRALIAVEGRLGKWKTQ